MRPSRIIASLAPAFAVVGLVGLVGVPAAGAAAGGNSVAAHRCRFGGWETVYRSDGSAFTNEGDCASYAAHAGQFETLTITGFAGATSGTTNLSCDTTVHIFGTAFTNATGVAVGGVNTTFTVVSDTEIAASVPSSAPSTGSHPPDGANTAASPTAYTYNGCGGTGGAAGTV